MALPRGDAPLSRLRAIEIIRVPGRGRGLTTVLRDPEKIAKGDVDVPAPLDAALRYFDGRTTFQQALTAVLHRGIDARTLAALSADLDDAGMLDGETFERRRRAALDAFRRAPVRGATHAGGAYPGEASALSRYIDERCLSSPSAREPLGTTVGLVAPHMDLWRAADGYGAAYGVLQRSLDPAVDLFVVLGTCHAGMRSAFSVTLKPFETPLGSLEVDDEAVSELGRRSDLDVFEDEYKHRGEHSIEFQMVFLTHLLGRDRSRSVRVLPILAGLGRAQVARMDPAKDDESERFLAALEEIVAARRGRVVIIAGADLAHVGPRFGDPEALDPAGRERLSARDERSLGHVEALDASAFFADTTEDQDERRVCGVGPIYSLLRVVRAAGGGSARRLRYTQHVDETEGSVVSHASFAFPLDQD